MAVAQPQEQEPLFVRNRLLEDTMITVVAVEEQVRVPETGPWRLEKTGTKKFTYDNGEERWLRPGDHHYEHVVGSKLRKRTWNTIYTVTNNLSIFLEVLYGEEDE